VGVIKLKKNKHESRLPAGDVIKGIKGTIKGTTIKGTLMKRITLRARRFMIG